MKIISALELPEQLEGFAGGSGFKSIQRISESELGFDVNIDVKGYISDQVDGIYYAEVIQGNGDADYACGEIDELQKWVTDKVYELSNDQLPQVTKAAQHFLSLYKEDLADADIQVAKTTIREWWGMTEDQYEGLDYEDVEKEILSKF